MTGAYGTSRGCSTADWDQTWDLDELTEPVSDYLQDPNTLSTAQVRLGKAANLVRRRVAKQHIVGAVESASIK
jgi:hypothetical protein